MTTRKAAVLVDGRKCVFSIKRTHFDACTQYRIVSKGKLVGYVYDSLDRSRQGRSVRRTSAHVIDCYGFRNKLDRYNVKGGPGAAFAIIVRYLEGNRARATPTAAHYFS